MVTDMDTTALIYKVLCAHDGSFELGELHANISTMEDDLESVLGNQEMFTRAVSKGNKLIVAKTKMRLCRANGCSGCSNLHLCKFYLYGTCPSNERQGCRLCHEMTSEHNIRVLREHYLEELDRKELCTLLLQNDNALLPPVCFTYNKGSGEYGYCPDKGSCRRLHVCERYITGTCAADVDCGRSHDFYEPHPLNTLQQRGVPNELVASILSTYRNIQAIGHTNDASNTLCKKDSDDCLLKSKALPSHWDKSSVPETGFKRVALQSSSAEHKNILDLFHHTMTGFSVKSIERVQNRILWEVFSWQGDVMRKTNAGKDNEKQLFHGTDSKHVDAICLQNIDWRIGGTQGTPYGQGSYFSKDAKFSHSYTSQSGVRSMFVCRVLVGNYTQGHSSYLCPPSKDGSHTISYDSCVDDIYNPSVFMVVGKHQVYPEYLIQYREGSRPETYVPSSNFVQNQSHHKMHWQPIPVMLHSQATPVLPNNARFRSPCPTGQRTPRPTLTHASAQFGSLNSLTHPLFQPGLMTYVSHPPPWVGSMTSIPRAPPSRTRRSQFTKMKAKSKSMASLDNL
ncbi:protein mono-ADP-ribosyltransferase PARP12-like isoform X1 [Salvelinus alpinus]|uniref:protein mono-ADP-ribosyltransferase PARP12-like isoform X1 n=2 Tax=Salvelinus alpinus TaxID=8036 RepID=UPI0039FCA77F